MKPLEQSADEIEIKSMPVCLQANYCIGRNQSKVIECCFYNQSICLNTCRYATTMKRYENEARDRVVRQGERSTMEVTN